MNKQIRVSLHAEMQKFGNRPDPTKCSAEHSTGLDLSYTESRALFAVQKLLDVTGYKGNIAPATFRDLQYWKYEGSLPRLEVTKSDYLEAYGVHKYKTSRNKMEYSSSERKTALDALDRLSKRTFTFSYARIKWDKNKRGKQASELIQVQSPVFLLEPANNKYRITASPILVDQIDSYFVLKPFELYENPVETVLFLEYLLVQARHKQGKKVKSVLRLDPETLAYKLRLDKLIQERQWKRIRNRLNSLYAFAKDQGYLNEYAVDQDGSKVETVDILNLRMAA